ESSSRTSGRRAPFPPRSTRLRETRTPTRRPPDRRASPRPPREARARCCATIRGSPSRRSTRPQPRTTPAHSRFDARSQPPPERRRRTVAVGLLRRAIRIRDVRDLAAAAHPRAHAPDHEVRLHVEERTEGARRVREAVEKLEAVTTRVARTPAAIGREQRL